MSRELDEARRMVNERLRQAGDLVAYGTIESADETARTCDVKVGGIVYEGVLLYATENKDLKGVVLIPKKGSTVLISRVATSSRMYVEMFSEIDKVLLSVGDKLEFTIDAQGVRLTADEIVLNGGDNHGLVKIEELAKRLKSLEQKFNSHVHSGVVTAVSGGSGAPAVGTPGNTGAPTSTSSEFQGGYSGYENDKIKH